MIWNICLSSGEVGIEGKEIETVFKYFSITFLFVIVIVLLKLLIFYLIFILRNTNISQNLPDLQAQVLNVLDFHIQNLFSSGDEK